MGRQKSIRISMESYEKLDYFRELFVKKYPKFGRRRVAYVELVDECINCAIQTYELPVGSMKI